MSVQIGLAVKSPHPEIATAHRIKKQFSSVPPRRRRKRVRAGKEVAEKAVDWSAIIGVVAGAVVANLVHWGFASINGMVVAALCWGIGQAFKKK